MKGAIGERGWGGGVIYRRNPLHILEKRWLFSWLGVCANKKIHRANSALICHQKKIDRLLALKKRLTVND